MVEDMAEDMRRLEATATAQHAELSTQAARAEQSAGALRTELDANCAAMATMEAQMRHMEQQVGNPNQTQPTNPATLAVAAVGAGGFASWGRATFCAG